MRFGWIRVHYFLLYAVVGGYLPYAPLYLHQRGLSDAQIGWVIGVYGVAVLIMPAAMTYLADRRVPNRALIGAGYVATTAALGMLWVSQTFWPLLMWSLVFSVAYTPVFALLDGLTFGAMHEAEARGERPPPYHRTRLYGSVGFMVPAAVVLWLLWDTRDVRPAILLTTGCALAAALTSVLLPTPARIDDAPADGVKSVPTRDALRVLWRPPVRSFMGAMFLLFLSISIFYGFFSRYLQELGVAERWAGAVVNIGVAVEIVVILFSGRLLRVIGLRGVLIIGAAAMVVRMLLLGAFESAWVAIAAQALHGPAVLAMYVMPPMYLNQKASPAFRNSMQGVYGALCFGVARVVGSVAGGHVSEVGLRWAFVAAGLLAAGALVWLIVRFRDDAACAAIERRVSNARPAPEEPAPSEPRLPDP